MISPAVKIRAILFDWDGTLVNSLEVKIKNAGTLFQKVFDLSLPGLIPAATPSVLKTLQEKGCFLFISSSAATEELKEIAGSLGLSKYFLEAGGEIMGSYPGFNKGKDHVNHVCQKYGLAREELLFVGG